ncbi:hypothetical protein JHK86_010377 [Glycine max]|nr:hypothetical protein JHK86_010377 [Glycine max]
MDRRLREATETFKEMIKPGDSGMGTSFDFYYDMEEKLFVAGISNGKPYKAIREKGPSRKVNKHALGFKERSKHKGHEQTRARVQRKEQGSKEVNKDEVARLIAIIKLGPLEIPEGSLLGQTVITSDHALKLESVPDWIAIVGSGYIVPDWTTHSNSKLGV